MTLIPLCSLALLLHAEAGVWLHVDDPSVSPHVQAELEAQGLTVHKMVCAEDGSVGLRRCVEGKDGALALRVRGTPPEQIEVYDIPGDRGSHEPAIEGRAGAVAFQAAELLRAALLGRVEKRKPLAPQERRAARPRRPRWVLGVGGIGSWAPGRFRGHAHGLTSLQWRTWARAGFELEGWTPLTPREFAGEQGEADVSWGAVLLGLRVPLRPENVAVQFDAAAGVGGVLARMRGRAAAPYVSRTDHVTVGLPYARVAVAPAVHRRVRLNFGLLGALASPGLAVQFADTRIARLRWVWAARVAVTVVLD